MNGHERRRQLKRGQIIRSATKLFERYGFRRVRVLEIAQHAGVAQVTIYKYFKNKDILIRQCIREYFTGKAREYADLLRSDRPYIERLSAIMIHGFAGELVEEVLKQDPEYVTEIIKLRQKALLDIASPLFKEGRKKGFLVDGISNEAILAYFDIIAEGFARSTAYREYERGNPGAFDEIQRIALRAILKQPPA